MAVFKDCHQTSPKVLLKRWCFCGGVFLVMLWLCFFGGVVVSLWWCCGVFVVAWLCFCGGVFEVVILSGCVLVVFLWWCF